MWRRQRLLLVLLERVDDAGVLQFLAAQAVGGDQLSSPLVSRAEALVEALAAHVEEGPVRLAGSLATLPVLVLAPEDLHRTSRLAFGPTRPKKRGPDTAA